LNILASGLLLEPAGLTKFHCPLGIGLTLSPVSVPFGFFPLVPKIKAPKLGVYLTILFALTLLLLGCLKSKTGNSSPKPVILDELKLDTELDEELLLDDFELIELNELKLDRELDEELLLDDFELIELRDLLIELIEDMEDSDDLEEIVDMDNGDLLELLEPLYDRIGML
jgi:hypothetical protein